MNLHNIRCWTVTFQQEGPFAVPGISYARYGNQTGLLAGDGTETFNPRSPQVSSGYWLFQCPPTSPPFFQHAKVMLGSATKYHQQPMQLGYYQPSTGGVVRVLTLDQYKPGSFGFAADPSTNGEHELTQHVVHTIGARQFGCMDILLEFPLKERYEIIITTSSGARWLMTSPAGSHDFEFTRYRRMRRRRKK